MRVETICFWFDGTPISPSLSRALYRSYPFSADCTRRSSVPGERPLRAEKESFRRRYQAADAAKFLPCDFLLGCCRHQLIAEFFRPSSQAFDVLLPVSLFEGFCSFIDVRQ